MHPRDFRGEYAWEENTERRLNIAEQKLDKLLDPETGIYAKLTRIEGQLARWAIAILSTLLVNIAITYAF